MSNPDQALLRQAAAGTLVLPAALHGNPLAQDLGATLLALDAPAGTLRLGFTPGPRCVQGNGAVQGGIVAAMLDFAAAFVVLARLAPPQVAVTVSLDLQFLRATQAGPLVAEARLRRQGARLAFVEATLAAAGADEASACASAVLALTRA